MTPVKIKICGITRSHDLVKAGILGADAIGMVVDVPSSPRNITIARARALLKRVPSNLTSIVVTAPTSLTRLQYLYRQLQPDAFQVHGDLVTNISEIKQRSPSLILIKAINVTSQTAQCIHQRIDGYDVALLDTHQKGLYGGTGEIHDWKLSRRLKQLIHPTPIFLAGGLTPDNVQTAIRIVEPFAVDVSTGVELKPGIKDEKKMKSFITNVRMIGG